MLSVIASHVCTELGKAFLRCWWRDIFSFFYIPEAMAFWQGSPLPLECVCCFSLWIHSVLPSGHIIDLSILSFMFPFATLHLLETFATFESMATFKTLPAFPALTTFRAIVTTFPHFATFGTGEVNDQTNQDTENKQHPSNNCYDRPGWKKVLLKILMHKQLIFCLFCHLLCVLHNTSIITHKTFLKWHQSYVINHWYDVIKHRSIICPLSCVLCHPSSVLCPLSSALCYISYYVNILVHLPHYFWPLSSVLCQMSLFICPLSSVHRHLCYIISPLNNHFPSAKHPQPSVICSASHLLM